MLSLWNTFSLSKVVDELFEDFWLCSGVKHHENDDGTFVTTVNLPGVSETDVVVDTSHGCVKVKGTKKTDTSSYCVLKTFSVPRECNLDELKATLKDGVLTLTMPKKTLPDSTEVKKIPVTVEK